MTVLVDQVFKRLMVSAVISTNAQKVLIARPRVHVSIPTAAMTANVIADSKVITAQMSTNVLPIQPLATKMPSV